jgi:hypothetical protein
VTGYWRLGFYQKNEFNVVTRWTFLSLSTDQLMLFITRKYPSEPPPEGVVQYGVHTGEKALISINTEDYFRTS